MKRLYTKFLLGYLGFIILGFLTIALFSSRLTEQYLLRSTGEKLYNEASLLAQECAELYSGSDLDLISAKPAIQALASYMDASVWLMDRQGEIVYDSSHRDTHLVIPQFNPADPGQQHYTVGYFYGHFKQETLTVCAPISGNYQIRGYVLLHVPAATALAPRDPILNVIYLTGLILFGLSLILPVIFFLLISRPIKKVSMAASQFAQGNLNYRCDLHSEDEMGYLSKTLNYMASELSKTEEFQRKFISNVSHDFRSPLTSIKGYLEAMLDGTIPPEMQGKYLEIVISETERLTKLTNNLLVINNVNANGMVLDISDFDICDTIKRTIETFEGVCAKKKIKFKLVFSEKSLFITADFSKIQQVLYNLIDNAIKFSNNDSSIIISATDKNDKVIISIKDFGIGIPRESLNMIWDRFYKTDLSRGKDKKGTGLGLAIVKDIITAHNEYIDVVSTEGVGTEFSFALPRMKKETGIR